ncbi:MAG: two-component sensor histidine kinase [Alphaproteobacteria bacterium]|nr:two-component sensor histidine kinase [Alphaproteobacteria bacterium]
METRPGLGLSQRDAGILDSIPEPLVIVDRQRTVTAANIAAVRDIGIAYPGRALALSLRHPAALAAVDEVLLGGKARTIEVALRAPTLRTFTLIVAPLQWTGTVGAVLIFHDVTSERRAQQMRADFVANASHELRSPLAAMVGFVETLRGPAKDDEAARERFLDIMAAEGARMTRLIEDLLSLSAIEADEHVIPQGRVDVARTLAEVIDTLVPSATEKDMRIRTEILVALPEVAGDSGQLAQVFRNLIENAIAYGRAGSEILIVARPLERMPEGTRPGVAVSVQDQGEGIAREHIPRLTERFYRVDSGRSRKLGGTGLGLAIVKHILNRHRGRLAIESEQGRGSRFTVSLPAA